MNVVSSGFDSNELNSLNVPVHKYVALFKTFVPLTPILDLHITSSSSFFNLFIIELYWPVTLNLSVIILYKHS